MLGSHFDLSKEVAAIAARREKTIQDATATVDRAYDDFDRRIHEFVRLLTSDGSRGELAIRVKPDHD